ncbi:hypothetical protein [Umezawaea beigongshangensis]|uniref:hypothetical protein n=1 Tax=Umezawaea beigongshangensis TaxID=2780383 RepID=UPI0018F23ED3|nr:hypothetical protein [Umezawaea beigongshangensis]
MSEPRTEGGNVKITLLAVLAPLGTGLLLLDAYLFWGAVGVVLTTLAWVCFLAWWRAKHGEFFPRHASTTTVVVMAVITTLLFLMCLGAAQPS